MKIYNACIDKACFEYDDLAGKNIWKNIRHIVRSFDDREKCWRYCSNHGYYPEEVDLADIQNRLNSIWRHT